MMEANRKSRTAILKVATSVLFGFAFAMFFHRFRGAYKQVGYPGDSFLIDPRDIANDLLSLTRRFENGTPFYCYDCSIYFPFAAVIFWFFSLFQGVRAYYAYGVVFTAGTSIFFYKSLLRTGFERLQAIQLAVVFVFFTYPFLFCMDRANIEAFIFLFIAAFFYCYRTKRLHWGALCIAAAGALKLYPLLFTVFFLRDRNYRAFLETLLYTAILSLIATFTLAGGLEGLSGMLFNQKMFHETVALTGTGVHFSASLFSVVKLCFSYSHDIAGLFKVYRWFAILAFVGLSTVASFSKRISFSEVLILITAIIVVLPQVSYDYKLILMYFPFVFAFYEPDNLSRDWWIWALLFVPKAYVPMPWGATLGVVLNPLLICLLVARIVWKKSLPMSLPWKVD